MPSPRPATQHHVHPTAVIGTDEKHLEEVEKMKQQATTKSVRRARAHHRSLWSILLILTVLIGTGALLETLTISEVLPVAFAKEHSMKCYSDGFDRDGDGYAGLSAEDAKTAYKLIEWDGRLRTNCPSGYVRFVADCNDLDPNVSPGKGERGFNGKDDNCNGVIDEPTFDYYAEGNHNTTYSFRMRVNLNSQALLDQKEAGRLYAELQYAKLKDTSNVVTRGKYLVNVFYPQSSSARLNVAVGNSDSATVFRARVAFYRKTDAGEFRPIGSRSDWYYTMTNGAMDKTQKRARIVLKGLKEFSDSLNGLVGYRGREDVDGTRYGADRNEGYCTEFYVWVTKNWLPGVTGNDTWDDMIDFFRDNRSYYSPSEIPARAAPGDYLPIDSNDDGKKNHSGMFLAYDTSTNRVWTLEGNAGNRVVVKKRALETEIKGLGYLLRSELR